MKDILTVLLTLVAIDISAATLPTIADEGQDIVFDTSVTKWTLTPSDACYFQAHKLDECWTIDTVYDLGACIECIFAGQLNPNMPTCDIMTSSVIEECAQGNCYGANFCKDKAMDFFNCVVDDECSDPNSGEDETGLGRDIYEDVCKDEIYNFSTCLAETDYDVETCTECIFEGQLDPDYFLCDDIDCEKIGICRDTYCDDCEDEFNVFSNCALGEGCDIVCSNPGDACYDQYTTANSCAAFPRNINACLSCYSAGQSNPHKPTCNETDCDEYTKCLEEKCTDCADEYMSAFACQDSEAGCDVICSDFRRLAKRRSHPRPPHHFRGLGRHRKRPRVNSPPHKPH
eukprot:CCRYP_017652-RA/>CCRYP_017652-RA protein AED:0.45 eAED:0.45 QI:0/-1/0/1/-1/1/1/0/343